MMVGKETVVARRLFGHHFTLKVKIPTDSPHTRRHGNLEGQEG
jgi:hypothetical protein